MESDSNVLGSPLVRVVGVALTNEEYKSLVSLSIQLRILESMLADIVIRLKESNKVLRELLLKEASNDNTRTD